MLARLQDKSAFAPIADPPALAGHAARLPAARRRLAALPGEPGPEPVPGRRHGPGQDHPGDRPPARWSARQAAEVPPTLIIAPTSVLGNWRKEIERFAPRACGRWCTRAAGAPRTRRSFKAACRQHDVVLTSFALARLDEKLLRGAAWHRVVVDEAQNIKNPQAAQTRAILKLAAPHRLALTGTPVENRLRDLWSIFNFLNPGYLGKEAQFRKVVRDADPQGPRPDALGDAQEAGRAVHPAPAQDRQADHRRPAGQDRAEDVLHAHAGAGVAVRGGGQGRRASRSRRPRASSAGG